MDKKNYQKWLQHVKEWTQTDYQKWLQHVQIMDKNIQPNVATKYTEDGQKQTTNSGYMYREWTQSTKVVYNMFRVRTKTV